MMRFLCASTPGEGFTQCCWAGWRKDTSINFLLMCLFTFLEISEALHLYGREKKLWNLKRRKKWVLNMYEISQWNVYELICTDSEFLRFDPSHLLCSILKMNKWVTIFYLSLTAKFPPVIHSEITKQTFSYFSQEINTIAYGDIHFYMLKTNSFNSLAINN